MTSTQHSPASQALPQQRGPGVTPPTVPVALVPVDLTPVPRRPARRDVIAIKASLAAVRTGAGRARRGLLRAPLRDGARGAGHVRGRHDRADAADDRRPARDDQRAGERDACARGQAPRARRPPPRPLAGPARALPLHRPRPHPGRPRRRRSRLVGLAQLELDRADPVDHRPHARSVTTTQGLPEPASAVGARADDGDRAVGVVQDAVADRAQQQAHRVAATACPTTTSCAPAEASTSARTAPSRTAVRRTATCGYFCPHPASRSASTASSADASQSTSDANSSSIAVDDHACTATRSAPRAAAASKANASAASLTGEPSIPTTTGPSAPRVPRGRPPPGRPARRQRDRDRPEHETAQLAQPAVAEHQQLRPAGLRTQHLDRGADRHLGSVSTSGRASAAIRAARATWRRETSSSWSRYRSTQPVGWSAVVQENARTSRRPRRGGPPPRPPTPPPGRRSPSRPPRPPRVGAPPNLHRRLRLFVAVRSCRPIMLLDHAGYPPVGGSETVPMSITRPGRTSPRWVMTGGRTGGLAGLAVPPGSRL